MRSKESGVGGRRPLPKGRCSGLCTPVGNPLDIGNRYSPGDGVGSAFPSSDSADFSSRGGWCDVEGDGNFAEGAFGELVFGFGSDSFSTSVVCFGRGGKTNPGR